MSMCGSVPLCVDPFPMYHLVKFHDAARASGATDSPSSE